MTMSVLHRPSTCTGQQKDGETKVTGLCIHALRILYCTVEDGVVCVVDGAGGEWAPARLRTAPDLKF